MKQRRKPLILKARRWFPLLMGGAAMQVNLSGCDPDVRSSILTGVQTSLTGLLTSVIDAFFLSISGAATPDPTTTTTTVVKAVYETAQMFVA